MRGGSGRPARIKSRNMKKLLFTLLFCAAAAAMGRALCEDGEMLHIIPATHGRAWPE